MSKKEPMVCDRLRDRQGNPIELHGTYYGGDGTPWHVCAANETKVYAYRADRPEPEVGEEGQPLKRLKPEWLSKRKPYTWLDWREDMCAVEDKLLPLPKYAADVHNLRFLAFKLLETDGRPLYIDLPDYLSVRGKE